MDREDRRRDLRHASDGLSGRRDGAYPATRSAEVRPVARVDWHDLHILIEGEAIVLFGGRRIYAACSTP